MKTETCENTNMDLDLFREAFHAAEEIYGPMGFVSPCYGVLLHKDLEIELFPFWDRGEETPIEYALRSAYERGRAKGRKESQKAV